MNVLFGSPIFQSRDTSLVAKSSDFVQIDAIISRVAPPPPYYLTYLHINSTTHTLRILFLIQSTIKPHVAPIMSMLRRVIANAPRASRALSTSVRPAVNSQARIAAPASITAKRSYHEKDKLSLPRCLWLFHTSNRPHKQKPTTILLPRLHYLTSTNAQLTSHHS